MLPLPTSQPSKKSCGRKQHDVHAKSESQLRTKMQMLNVNCLLGLCCPCLLCATVQKEIQPHRKKTWRSRRPPALKTRFEFQKTLTQRHTHTAIESTEHQEESPTPTHTRKQKYTHNFSQSARGDDVRLKRVHGPA